jgi:hypothetical protein
MQKTKIIYCNRCKEQTNHVLLGSHCRTYHYDYSTEVTYSFWICAGCDSATLEAAWISSVMSEEEYADYIFYYPPRAIQDLIRKVFKQLPKPLTLLYEEVIKAFNHQLHLLCAAGLRALIEGICQDKQIKGATLEKKINGLESILPKNIVEHLHGFRFLGNKAMHELDLPQRDNLKIAIEVSEDLLNFLYELDYKASQLPKKMEMH